MKGLRRFADFAFENEFTFNASCRSFKNVWSHFLIILFIQKKSLKSYNLSGKILCVRKFRGYFAVYGQTRVYELVA